MEANKTTSVSVGPSFAREKAAPKRLASACEREN